MRYIGPDYQASFIAQNGQRLNPKAWTADQIKLKLQHFPELAPYFGEEVKADVAADITTEAKPKQKV